jgi:hypothetical protein
MGHVPRAAAKAQTCRVAPPLPLPPPQLTGRQAGRQVREGAGFVRLPVRCALKPASFLSSLSLLLAALLHLLHLAPCSVLIVSISHIPYYQISYVMLSETNGILRRDESGYKKTNAKKPLHRQSMMKEISQRIPHPPSPAPRLLPPRDGDAHQQTREEALRLSHILVRHHRVSLGSDVTSSCRLMACGHAGMRLVDPD